MKTYRKSPNSGFSFGMRAATLVVVLALLLHGANTAEAFVITVDPDPFTDGTVIDNAFPGIILSAVGSESGLDGHVYAQEYLFNSTSPNVFGNNVWSEGWIGDSQDPTPVWLKVTFLSPASEVSIDSVGNDTHDQAELRAYDSSDFLLDTDISGMLRVGDVETLTVSAPGISYVLAGGYDWEITTLDHLTYVPEPGTVLLVGLGGVALVRKRRVVNRREC